MRSPLGPSRQPLSATAMPTSAGVIEGDMRLTTAQVKSELSTFRNWVDEHLSSKDNRVTGAEMLLSLKNVLMSETMTHAVSECLQGKLEQYVSEETTEQIKA